MLRPAPRVNPVLTTAPVPEEQVPQRGTLRQATQAKHGTVLVVVDRPASIGALPLAVARDRGCPVAYLRA